MNNKLFISLICLFTLITSCSNNDDTTTNEEAINIPWSLKSVIGGLVGTNDTFVMGTILWTFDDSTNTLIVLNNNTEDVIYDGLQTGSYNYTISTIDGLDYLIVDGSNNLGKIESINNELTLDNGLPLDGLFLTFETYTP